MPALVREGEVFAGKYRVEHILGEGGHGIVFAARNIELGERVAVKLLKGVADDPVTAERFMREARAVQKIRGEGVARVHAVDRLENGDLFMVMEYLDGRDLRQEVVESGPLGVADAVDCILQVCDVLGRAHAMGIIHRDIKSANLFTVSRPDGHRQIKVLDFGIARSLDPVDESLTQMPQMMGSPLYMAPEQIIDGRTVDERTDIWGLGATLFELLTGVPPFAGNTILQVLMRVQSQPPEDMRALRPEVTPALERVITRCLEKDREKRFPDVGSLSAALAPFSRLNDGTQPSAPSRELPSAPAGRSARLSMPGAPLSLAEQQGNTAPVEPATVVALRRPSSEPPQQAAQPPMSPMRFASAPSHGNGIAATVVSAQRQPHPSAPPPRVSVMPAPMPAPMSPPSTVAPRASGSSSTLIVIASVAMVAVLVAIAVVAKARHRVSDGAADDRAAVTSADTVPTPVPVALPTGAPTVAVVADVPSASARASAEPPIASARPAAGVRGPHIRTGGGAAKTPTTGATTPLPDDRQ